MADGVQFDSSQVVNLAAALQSNPAEVRDRVHLVTRAAAVRIQRAAKIAAPVDTGNLRNSIRTHTTRSANQSSVEVGPSANYGAYVEFGTSRMAPQPYLIPAFNANKQPFIQALQQLANGALG